MSPEKKQEISPAMVRKNHGDRKGSERSDIVGFKERGRGHKPRNAGSLWTLDKGKTRSLVWRP